MTQNILVSRLTEEPNYSEYDKEVNAVYPMVDGYYVNHELGAFCVALRKKPAFRNVKFGQLDPRNTSVRNDIWVYRPDDVYALGRIGYADYNISEGSRVRYSYLVDSRKISNYKYRVGSNARYWALSTKVDRAVTNAAKYLSPYSFVESCRLTAYDASMKMMSAVSELDNSTRTALNGLSEDIGLGVYKSKVFAELRVLADSDYEFVTDGLAELVGKVLEHVGETKEMQGVTYNTWMLRFQSNPYAPDDPKVTMVKGEPLVMTTSGTASFDSAFGQDAYVTMHKSETTLNELSEMMTGKVALLNMMDNNTFVEGVGVRINEQVMYILDEQT